jgi:flagellar motility protein MotE (MotC chaperone)/sporulation protein YlmC with PRC-barrel domain
MRLIGPQGTRIGRVREAAVAPREHPQRVSRFLFGWGRTRFAVRWDQVLAFSDAGIQLSDENFAPYYGNDYHLLLTKDLLDQQIIDVNGRKVVRVNDLALRVTVNGNEQLWVHEVGVGLQGAFRRLTEGILPNRIIREIQRKMPPNSIPWEACNIVEPDPQRRLRLLISHDRLERLHPADLADIVEELGTDEREALFETLDEEIAADTLEEIKPTVKTSILHSLDSGRAADILEEMDPADAAAALYRLEEHARADIVRDMEREPAVEVAELLEYEDDTAAGMMGTRYLSRRAESTVGEIVTSLRGEDSLLKRLTHVFLVDREDRLVGSVALGRLAVAMPQAPATSLAFRKTLRVTMDAKPDDVVEIFDKYNLYALPVVDSAGGLRGVITADDVIAYLSPEIERGL